MKRIHFLAFLFIMMSFFMVSCGSDDTTSKSGVPVIYHLEGAKYQNSYNDVTLYYDYKSDVTDVSIKALESFSSKQIEYPGYEFVGWYMTKNADGTYSNEFDFANEKVNRDGIELYAYWKKIVKYSFDLYAIDEDGTQTLLQKYAVDEGDKFVDSYQKASKRVGYTWISGYLDTNTNKWVSTFLNEDGTTFDMNLTHPGGETISVNVYARFIKGTYKIVSNAADLKAAKSSNIYLVNDIDLEGAEFKFNVYNSKTLLGNNHKIYNFKVPFSAASFVTYDGTDNAVKYSIFDSINKSTIKDVTFDDVEFTITTTASKTKAIYLSCISFDAENAVLENVSVNATYKVVQLPAGFDNLIINTDAVYYEDESVKASSSYTNVTVNLQKID